MADVALGGKGGGCCRSVKLVQGNEASGSGASVCGVTVVLLVVRVAETLR
jgi:hypothetical protein